MGTQIERDFFVWLTLLARYLLTMWIPQGHSKWHSKAK